MFRSLAIADYRRLWACIAAGGAGRWALVLAVGWLIETMTHSTLWVGASLFALQGPSLVVAPLAGVLTDRFRRAHVLAAAYTATALAATALAVLTARQGASLATVLGLTLVVGVAAAFQATAASALLPNIVSGEALLNGIALQRLAQQGTEFLGPAVGAPLLALLGPWSVFALCAVLYAVAALLPLRIHGGGRAERLAGSDVLAPIRQAFAYVRRADPLGVLIAVVSFHCCLTMAFMGMLPGFLQLHLHGGSALYGATMTAIGLGAICGVLPLTAIRGKHLRGRLYLISGVASGLTLAAFAWARSEPAALALAITVGGSQAMFMALTATAVQERCADAFRGRVSSLYTLVTMGAMASFNWGYGAIGTAVDPARIMTVTGGCFVVAFCTFLAGAPALRRVCGWGRPAPLASAAAG